MAETKEVMTILDVAHYLGVHKATVYKYAQRRQIPAFKIGSDWRFSKKSIDQWIEEQVKMNGEKV